MSVIQVSCIDQVMTLTNTPVIASGGVNENHIEFSFCSQWDGFAKVCAFYQQPGVFYYALLNSEDTCVIPAEVCAEPGPMHFGVVGVKDDVTRTSEVIKYKLVEGVMTEIADPTEDIYQQLLAELSAIREMLGNIEMPEDMVTKAQLQEHTNDKDNPHGVTAAQVGAAAADHTHKPADIGAAAAGHTHTPASIGAAAADHTHTPASIGAAAAGHTHTPAAIGAAALDSFGKVNAAQASPRIIVIDEPNHTLAAEEAGAVLRFATTITEATLTIPDDLDDAAFPLGTDLEVHLPNVAGVLTINTASTTTTLFTPDGNKTSVSSSGCYPMFTLLKLFYHKWQVRGDFA